MIKLVAFDLDGTIGDTIPMCLKALKKAVTPYVTAIHLADFSISEQDNSVLLRYFSFGLHRLKSYHVRFEQEKNALFVSH